MTLGLTALELARIQFAFTVSFHIIFPAISIGLASFLAVLEWRWLRTNDAIYKDLLSIGSNLRGCIWNGRCLWCGHELSIWNQLERIFKICRWSYRPFTHL